jgi:xylose dehydrogenase (NAD/NADP)
LAIDDQGRLGWGLLGTADIARRRFLPALRQSDRSYLAVLGSRSYERAAAAVAQHGSGRAAGSYEAVLADPAVDLVYVPLPGPLHHEWVLKALAAGKHVLCEKALVRSVAQVREIEAAAQAAGRVVMEGFMYRFHPQWDPAVLKPLLAEVGEVTSAHCWTSFPYDPTRDRWQDAAMRGGALWEIGCYCLDALAWQFGEVAEVNVLASAQPGHDLTAVALRFATGMPATAWWSFSATWSKRFLVVGTTGSLELERPFQPDGAGCAWIERRRERRKVELPGADCFLREIDHFTAAANGKVPLAITLEDSARWIGPAEAIEQIR